MNAKDETFHYNEIKMNQMASVLIYRELEELEIYYNNIYGYIH